MSRLRVAPIVEGHGESTGAIRVLLERLWPELGGEFVDVKRPLRRPRSELVRRDDLKRAVEAALLILAEPPHSDDPALVLVLFDADDDPDPEKSCPRILGPRLLGYAREVDSRANVSCVIANLEYETWFVASAETLTEYLDLSEDGFLPDVPESQRLRSGWIEQRFRGKGWRERPAGARIPKYKKAENQAGMTAHIDLKLCRERCPSFAKLCRDLERFRNQENRV